MTIRKIFAGFAALAVTTLCLADAQAQIAASGSNASSGSNANSGSASSSRAQGGNGTGTGTGTANAGGGTATGGGGTAGLTFNQGNNSPSTVNNPNDVTIRSAPTIYVPNVVTGNVCALGASAGGSFLGWGAAAGMSWESMQCERRQQAALLWNMNTPDSRAAAKEIVCDTPEIRAAYRRSGSPCQADMQAVAGPQPTPQVQPVAPMAITFNPRSYTSGSECLNAAQAQRVPLSQCRGFN